jgi:hypothetical protein
VTTFPLDLLPRWCPFCGNRSIIGHGHRRKQAHDEVHDVIRFRRGRCPPCHKTFTILPVWSPPSGHYSFHCRKQAAQRIEQPGSSWEQSIPSLCRPGPTAGSIDVASMGSPSAGQPMVLVPFCPLESDGVDFSG